MARKSKLPIPNGYPDDPTVHDHKRSSLPGQSVEGISPDVLGYGRYGNLEVEDTVVLGHPEAAGVFTMDYDNNDPYLEARPRRQDNNYVSAEDIRRRQKGRGW